MMIFGDILMPIGKILWMMAFAITFDSGEILTSTSSHVKKKFDQTQGKKIVSSLGVLLLLIPKLIHLTSFK